jgi:tRNA pseudouridine13 synthase
VVSEVDRLLGMDAYGTSTLGVGGVIKEAADDFIVEEVLVDGSKADVNGAVPPKVLGSTVQRQRFLLCVLVKRNWDTFIAVKNVAKSLGIYQKRVQFAGIKDAKAITAQHITLENVTFEDAAKIDVKDVQVHPVGYIREMLSLFYLLGNHFTLTIKHLNLNKAELQDQINQTQQQITAVGGVPNFFGHQRFGTTRPITHLVGKALRQGNFREAAMLFLAKPSPYEHPASRQARTELQETQDFAQAAQQFPKQLRFERLMLMHLSEHPDDFVGAFRRLPPKLQALFVQAYQSYLFNCFLSERLKRGLQLDEVVEGDFVVGVERSGLPLTSIEKMATAQNIEQVNIQVKAGKLRVALPIVGFKQKLSGGVMGEVEAAVLQREGVAAEQSWSNELSRVGGKGGLRAVISPVNNFTLQKISQSSAGDLAVQLSFRLLRGSYATVVLRELMKPQDVVAAGF